MRIRKYPLRESFRDGKLFALHFPGLQGAWLDSLTARDEAPDTKLLFTSGFNDVLPLENAARAYALQAQGRLLIGDRAGTRQSLMRAVELAPAEPGPRVLLAGLDLESGRVGEAAAWMRDLRPADIPEDLRPFFAEVRRITDSLTAVAPPGAAAVPR